MNRALCERCEGESRRVERVVGERDSGGSELEIAVVGIDRERGTVTLTQLSSLA